MSSFKEIKCTNPKLELPKLVVSKSISNKKMQEEYFEETQNYYNITFFVGLMGSGKSSTLFSWYHSKKSPLYRQYHNIYYCCPKSSQESLKDNPWISKLPKENVFYDIDVQILNYIYTQIKSSSENDEEDEKSLIIIDDLQHRFRENRELETLFLLMCTNHRHTKLSIICLLQNYKKITPMERQVATNFVLFYQPKLTQESIFKEVLFNMKKDEFEELLRYIYDKPHNFLTINTKHNTLWKNYNKIIMEN